jgi:hypothetical protein
MMWFLDIRFGRKWTLSFRSMAQCHNAMYMAVHFRISTQYYLVHCGKIKCAQNKLKERYSFSKINWQGVISFETPYTCKVVGWLNYHMQCQSSRSWFLSLILDFSSMFRISCHHIHRKVTGKSYFFVQRSGFGWSVINWPPGSLLFDQRFKDISDRIHITLMRNRIHLLSLMWIRIR